MWHGLAQPAITFAVSKGWKLISPSKGSSSIKFTESLFVRGKSRRHAEDPFSYMYQPTYLVVCALKSSNVDSKSGSFSISKSG